MFNIQKANTKHNGKYDYSRVVYVNSGTKVEIICPLHGSFFQTPDKHCNAGTGCPRCKSRKLAMDRRMTHERFVERARDVHNDRYDYSRVSIVNGHTKVEIICPTHGSFFQTPTNHIDNKNGCPQCGYNVSASGRRWLDRVSTSTTLREHVITVDGQKFKVDGYDPSTNTIYEYFGVFWHGCPSYCDHAKVNPRNGVPYSTLYARTLERIEIFKRAGYTLVSTWGG